MTAHDALGTTQRTHMCGALRDHHAGLSVKLGGWVHRTRNLGGLIFLDLRDREGIVQVSFDPRYSDEDALQVAAGLTPETVVLVEAALFAPSIASTVSVCGPSGMPAVSTFRTPPPLGHGYLLE